MYTEIQKLEEERGEAGLAENVNVTTVASEIIQNEVPEGTLTTQLLSAGDQETQSQEQRLHSAVVGLLVLHSLKLICRSVQSTLRSMRNRMNAHFRSIYSPAGWASELLPPHKKALDQLHIPFSAMDKDVLAIVGLLCAKLVFVTSEDSPDQHIKGLFYGSCLTHIGIYGLTPIKHLEQAATALGMSPGPFSALIYTAQTKDSKEKCVM